MNKKYKVTYEYRGTVTVEVEAPNADTAENVGLTEADERIPGAIQVVNATVREVKS